MALRERQKPFHFLHTSDGKQILMSKLILRGAVLMKTICTHRTTEQPPPWLHTLTLHMWMRSLNGLYTHTHTPDHHVFFSRKKKNFLRQVDSVPCQRISRVGIPAYATLSMVDFSQTICLWFPQCVISDSAIL